MYHFYNRIVIFATFGGCLEIGNLLPSCEIATVISLPHNDNERETRKSVCSFHSLTPSASSQNYQQKVDTRNDNGGRIHTVNALQINNKNRKNCHCEGRSPVAISSDRQSSTFHFFVYFIYFVLHESPPRTRLSILYSSTNLFISVSPYHHITVFSKIIGIRKSLLHSHFFH